MWGNWDCGRRHEHTPLHCSDVRSSCRRQVIESVRRHREGDTRTRIGKVRERTRTDAQFRNQKGRQVRVVLHYDASGWPRLGQTAREVYGRQQPGEFLGSRGNQTLRRLARTLCSRGQCSAGRDALPHCGLQVGDADLPPEVRGRPDQFWVWTLVRGRQYQQAAVGVRGRCHLCGRLFGGANGGM